MKPFHSKALEHASAQALQDRKWVRDALMKPRQDDGAYTATQFNADVQRSRMQKLEKALQEIADVLGPSSFVGKIARKALEP